MRLQPKLHHVGIVQPSEAAVETLFQILGLEEDYRGFVPQFEALCIFAKASSGSAIEFVVPTGGTLARFNKGAGGVHHVAFQVEDLRATTLTLKGQGLLMVEEEPVKGAGNFICNFLRPSATRGVLTELVQEL